MKTIYVFGNELLNYDNLAKNISKEINIEDIKFKQISSLNDVFNIKEKNLNILDVVKGIKKTTLIKDINKIKRSNLYSLHDFDIAFYILLMKELNKINNINIIGIPQYGNKKIIKKDIIKIIEAI